jgi:hypothetical protein
MSETVMGGWRASGPIDQIAPALVAICGELTNPERGRAVNVETSKGGRYGYSYAELSAYFDVLRPICVKYGVAVLQPLTWRDGKPYVVTLLLHTSGQSLDHETPAIVDAEAKMSSGQALQSAITYAKRTGLGIFPMHPEHEDDDGNAAGGNATSAAPKCPTCGKSDKVIRSKRGSGWWCLKPCSTAFGDEGAASEREPGEDDGPESESRPSPNPAASSDGNCPKCGTAGRKTDWSKNGSLFCGKCRQMFGGSK